MDEKPTYEELEYRVKVFEREAVWRKQAEDALRESEEKYKHLTEELSDVVLTITLDGSLSYISPAIKEFGGYDPKKEVGNNIAKYFAKKSELIAALNLIEKISIDKTSSSIEFLFKPKNIEPFYVEVTGKPLIRKNKVVIIQCVMRDISERKQTEDALLESEEKYRLLIDNLPNIVFKGYKNGSVDFIDDKIELLTGYKKEEFNSRKINGLDIVVEEDKEKMRQTFIKALKTNKSYIREYRIKTKAGGVLWIQEGSQIVCDDSEEIEHISGAFLDITERRRIEIQLQQMDRIESMGALAGGIAHDFNNLLMGIQGRTSLMLLDSDSPHSNFEHLKGIDDYVKSAADLTKQLLGFARAEKYKVKTTDLNEVIKKQNQMFGRTRKEINILEKYEEKLWATEVDQGQIERVLLNIFVNAWQAMPGGGNIHIQTENIIIDENYNKPYHMRPGKYIRISVTDTGFGMDEATQRKVFDPFFTTKGIGIGTGLGLASAYGIIKNHSGYIDVYSEKGKGTTFEIY
ncbi:MAG: PAS domain S-box protein, partial [Desulfobulbaceae bacterium]|nr:PAS domain S-box protein [Desulfobulbaceae bacterium]